MIKQLKFFFSYVLQNLSDFYFKSFTFLLKNFYTKKMIPIEFLNKLGCMLSFNTYNSKQLLIAHFENYVTRKYVFDR